MSSDSEQRCLCSAEEDPRSNTSSSGHRRKLCGKGISHFRFQTISASHHTPKSLTFFLSSLPSQAPQLHLTALCRCEPHSKRLQLLSLVILADSKEKPGVGSHSHTHTHTHPGYFRTDSIFKPLAPLSPIARHLAVLRKMMLCQSLGIWAQGA